MLPRLKRDRGYLEANNIAIVGRPEDPYGRSVAWSRLSGGFPYRLQQKPGPGNSLGAIKFEMPNPWNVYLHDTPLKEIFNRAERDRSHGCVRVQLPSELARRLLADEQRWSSAAITDAIASGQTRTVPLGRPVPVYVSYWTTFVDSEGAVNFRPDVYGRDAPLIRALNPAARVAPLEEGAAAAAACNSRVPASTALAISD
jgi:murein L,D-transpeptidase YcbB/YkuD